MKKLYNGIAMAALGCLAFNASAQDNILAEKPIFTLGEAKTWEADGQEFTFNTDDLQKLVAVPVNTSNVFLYPENGTINTPENREKGAQGFYIDMESVMEVGSVSTTWEGAAANSFDIYLTNDVPTLAILSTEPTFSISGLGQYTENTVVMPEGAKGRYLVFQVTEATNWGWGVKIRSISAFEPQDDVLTTFKVTPGIVQEDVECPVTITLLNQLGMEMPIEEVEVLVSDNAIYSGGNLLVKSGQFAEFTAIHNEVTLTSKVYVASAPIAPAPSSIKTAIYTNTVSDYNATAEFVVAYNGGAVDNGEITFENGMVARSFGDTRCVFFSNSETTGAWNGNINPAENGYRALAVGVFSALDAECTIEFESTEGLDGHTFPYLLNAGEWNYLTVDVAGATKLGNLSIRFTEENKDDILLSNIYFTPTFIDGDENAPVLSDIVANPSMTSVELTFSATDDLSQDIYYTVTSGTGIWGTMGTSGQEVTFAVTGLSPGTEYSFTVTANDGLNTSEPKSVEVTTLAMPAPETPAAPVENVVVVYSNAYGKTELPAFDSWGSTAQMGIMETEENTYLRFFDYMNQWGGLVNLDTDVEGCKTLDFDIFGDNYGTMSVAPVWKDATGDTPNVQITVEGDVWQHVSIDLTEFGFDTYGTEVIQLALTNSTVGSFLIDNLYFESDSPLAVTEIVTGAEDTVNVYTLQGHVVKRNVSRADALQTLPAGLYIIGNKKVMVK